MDNTVDRSNFIVEKKAELDKTTVDFLEQIRKHREDNLKDVILYIYYKYGKNDIYSDLIDTEGNVCNNEFEISEFVDEINLLCSEYISKNLDFMVHLFTPFSLTEVYYGIDRHVDQKNPNIDKLGFYTASPPRVFHCYCDKDKYDKEDHKKLFDDFVNPLNKKFKLKLKEDSRITLIEYYEKACFRSTNEQSST